ncbi:MAG TPA: MmgE/PrpD family protein [Bryobacteraceae bacterium]|nr:MmgE/PrpD family protein [Bryobacteraceae bacterium]
MAKIKLLLSRRTVLQAAGGMLASGGLPHGMANAAENTSPVITRLSTYMSEAAGRALPEEAAEKTRHHILDTFAAMISGADLPPGRVALRLAQAHAGGAATIAASKLRCGAIEAAMINGMLAHSDETDDSHAPSHSHPGCSIVPAALAAGEEFGIDGARLLRAVALGYDIGPRVTMTLGGLPFQMQTHHSAHSIAGTFGSAAAAGCAGGFSAQQMRWVLDYAAQQAAGIAAWQRDTDHIEKSMVFAGMPARNGVSAAMVIHFGGTGVDDIFSGADNFLMSFAPKADPAGLVDELGTRYEITRTNIKKWTVGSPIQAPLDAIENLRKKHPFEAEDVQKVTVRVATSEAKTVNNREMPDICLQHMMAVMLIDKTASFQAAHDKARMKDPALLRQRAKVELVPDEELERAYPKRETIVEVTLKDGAKLTDRVEAVRGTAENPMPRAEVIAKCRDLIAPVLGAAPCDRLIEAVMGLDRVKNVRELGALLQKS